VWGYVAQTKDSENKMTKQQRAYGMWDSPIRVESMSGAYRFYDAKWDNRTATLVWHERRISGSALVAQRTGENPRDLIRDTSIGGRILFGGGGFTVGSGQVYFVGSESRIYVMPVSGGTPRPITPGYGVVGGMALSPNGRYLLYIHSYEGKDALMIVPTDGNKLPYRLFDDADFIMQPTWHPYGDRVACIAWDLPHMPWNQSRLHLLHLSADVEPRVVGQQAIAGAHSDESVFGPSFSPDSGYLAYASDRQGWWQLYLYDLDLHTHDCLTPEPAEYAVPGWLQDMRTAVWSPDSHYLYTLRNADSCYSLQQIDVVSREIVTLKALESYTHLEQIDMGRVSGEISVIAGATHIPDRVVTVQPAEDSASIRSYSSTEAIAPEYFARAQDITWASPDGVTIHGLYYPPTNPRFESGGLPPLIVYIHSGPTRQRFARHFPETHFFSTRGYAVLEPNYRGSTGYGRDFKNMLHGNWGLVDVEDAASGAQTLVERGLADGQRLVVMGESSGGFSVLQSLILKPGFYRAGIAQAPVTDQFALAAETHKFERHYTDVLLGPLPDAAPLYRDRSPVFHADRIQDPLALFHGSDDNVVPPDQSARVAAVLRRRGIPHVHQVYEGEGHSFRRPETRQDYYETVLRFLTQYVLYA
jgi:dipeptidyl aminopeptidase/acylaminoacyl peptidase